MPYGKAEVYENAPNWGGFKEYIELPDTSSETGIDVVGSDSDAPAVYYNLQGVEVVPAYGQIVIEVLGGKSVKKVFRD